jgi:hypothetical protein
MSTLKTCLSGLAALFPDAHYGKATPFSLFPCVTYNIIGSNTTRIPSFTTKSETFQLQFAIYDDSADGIDLVDLEEEVQDTLEAALGTYGIEEIRKQSTIGPRYLQDQKYWQIISTYIVTVCRVNIVATTTSTSTTTSTNPPTTTTSTSTSTTTSTTTTTNTPE